MQEVSIERFDPRSINEWNEFVAASKNGTFLFDRAYMDYHANRFADHSLLIRVAGNLSAILPANEREKTIESHGGLPYGGLILKPEARLPEVLTMFGAMAAYYHQLGFEHILYKCVPSYLHSFAANEEQFALFTIDAKLSRRNTSSVIVSEQRLPYTQRRTRSLKQARTEKLSITRSDDCTRFWQEVLVPNLQLRYNTDPVHTAGEMNLLISRFPANIRLYEVSQSTLSAGAVVYVYPNCVHTQYLSATEDGRQHGALDLLVDHLVSEYANKKYFSLGTSNNGGGPDLNKGVLNWKEGFGARTFSHDIYEIATNKFKLVDRYE